MSNRPVRPRGRDEHEELAADVLGRYALATRWTPSLPVPIEHIVEVHFGLTLLWEQIPEVSGEVVLGALSPTERTIRLNECHLDLFEQVVGPETFTLAHELAHWLYDAGDPDQGQLFESDPLPVLCRDVTPVSGSDAARLREVNANKLAACLLLPAHLVRRAVRPRPLGSDELRDLAQAWGVSKTTLRIRLEELRG